VVAADDHRNPGAPALPRVGHRQLVVLRHRRDREQLGLPRANRLLDPVLDEQRLDAIAELPPHHGDQVAETERRVAVLSLDEGVDRVDEEDAKRCHR
jgi:hypothetical protein